MGWSNPEISGQLVAQIYGKYFTIHTEFEDDEILRILFINKYIHVNK